MFGCSVRFNSRLSTKANICRGKFERIDTIAIFMIGII